ncbi:hypothetical protein VPH35_036847 [Triticum aestivum]
MRPLDEKETTMVLEKLFKFTGPNLKHLLERPSAEGPDPEPGSYCLRLHKNRVFYASKSLVRRASPRSARPSIGKFTHGGAFHCNTPDVAARGAQDCRKADTNGVVVLHQSDDDEYLRKEEELM